jgi:hypothetical protein
MQRKHAGKIVSRTIDPPAIPIEYANIIPAVTGQRGSPDSQRKDSERRSMDMHRPRHRAADVGQWLARSGSGFDLSGIADRASFGGVQFGGAGRDQIGGCHNPKGVIADDWDFDEDSHDRNGK